MVVVSPAEDIPPEEEAGLRSASLILTSTSVVCRMPPIWLDAGCGCGGGGGVAVDKGGMTRPSVLAQLSRPRIDS